MHRYLILVTVISAITGCATGWVRPNTTQAEGQRDGYECEQQATRMYPVAMRSVGPGRTTDSYTNCNSYGGQTNCSTTPGSYTPPPQTDVNAMNRSSARESCLQAKGYRYKWN